MRALRLGEGAAALLSRLAAALGALCGLACFALVCLAVVSRYFLGAPLPWIDATAAWLVVALVMLTTAETQRRDEHIGVDLLRERLRGRARRGAHVLSVLSVAAVSVILLHEGIETVAFSRLVGIATEVEAVPIWWVQLLIPIGASLMLVVAVMQLLVLLAGGEPRGPTGKGEAGVRATAE